MATIKLEIVSPDRVVYAADIDMLIARSTGGEIGILPKHIPLVTGLEPHAMKIHVDAKEQLVAVAGGFMEVTPDKITVLATAAEEPIDIDINRAQRAYERAQERLQRLREDPDAQASIIDEQRASLALKRAAARLQTAKTVKPGA
ncbi:MULTISPECIES: F0F1 ATP synthase subunit epsilon [Selenomonas]|uniref:F0F1 ATP synthase subunit epsilon n=1 Tax=Selenomonas TaxID=970 RepID=UPI0001E097C7|nr:MULTISPECIES: F0F1 ATP synthase subunit epsilon [Selenomonas]AKT53831.1 ATP synthase F1 subunit epsilon [Selenomonas sp. oral taxon 478]EFM22913.1 ATP synthase F1, epsilon subunit [Selenomonas sp. oral taxon 149 str. 67H29BP]